MNLDRRQLVISAAGLGVGGMTIVRLLPEEMLLRDRRPRHSRVAIVSAEQYSERLEELLLSALREFRLNLHAKSVLLKPNLVEYIAGVEVNTNPVLVGAAAEAFLKLGAKRVVVGEGPGHQRDTYLVLAESGLAAQLRSQKISFVDLNRDELFKVPTSASYTGLGHLWLPRTVLESDFVVSMPKIKTHHWAGVTLSMKNMFGVLPGSKYGWPKNVLHWKGIHRSILDICATAPMHFVIADGVVGMEGKPETPDAYLVVVKSEQTGGVIKRADWLHRETTLISFSECGVDQEVMVVMPAYGWVRGVLGTFFLEPVAARPWEARLVLSAAE